MYTVEAIGQLAMLGLVFGVFAWQVLGCWGVVSDVCGVCVCGGGGARACVHVCVYVCVHAHERERERE